MHSLPDFLRSDYPTQRLLRDSRGIETWEVSGAKGHHLLKLARHSVVLFKNEYEFLRTHPHPGLPRPVSWRQEQGWEIYLREFFPGRPVSEMFGDVAPSRIAELFGKILRALAFLHYHGWAHGDLSGENILIGKGGAMQIIDLEFLAPRHQPVDTIRGTPALMAPELFWGRPPTIPTDLYAIGCLLYALVAGRYPFGSGAFSELLQAHALEEAHDPCLNRPQFPAALGRVALRLLAKEPGSRFAEANDVLLALNQALNASEIPEAAPPRASQEDRLRAATTVSQQKQALEYLRGRSPKSEAEIQILAELLLKSGALEEMETVLPALPETIRPLYRGLLLNRRGDYEQALQHWQQVDPSTDSRALLSRATALYYTGQPDAAFHLLSEVPLEEAKERALVKNFEGNLLVHQRRLDEAQKKLAEALQAAQDSGQIALTALVRMNCANASASAGRYPEAWDNYLQAGEIYASLGRNAEKIRCDLNLAGLLRLFGHLERASALIGEAIEQLRLYPHPQLWIYATLLLADLEKKRGDYQRASGYLDEAETRLKTNLSAAEHGDCLISRAEIALSLGEHSPERLFEQIQNFGEKTADELLLQRLALLETLAGIPGAEAIAAEPIYFAAQKLVERGDLEFVLDNLMRGAALADRAGLPWPESLSHWGRQIATDIGENIPADYRPFFKHFYEKLWEGRPMHRSSTTPAVNSGSEKLMPLILDWIREVTGEIRLKELTEKILLRLLEFTRMERGFVLLKEGEQWTLMQTHRMNLENFPPQGEDQLSWSLTLKAAELGKPLLTTNAPEDPRLSGAKSISALQLKAILVLPFHFRGKTFGAVYLDSRLQPEHLDPTDLSTLEGLAEILGLAVNQATRFEAQAASIDQMSRDLERSRRELQTKYAYDNLVGRSSRTQEFLQRVDRVTEVRVPVLILGESGVGKELVARAIHFNGALRKGPFVAANCSAIPETLAESEFFGHERGAFTGALLPRSGLFEQAHGGTLFLDEIGDLALPLQAKLLRVLQEGTVKRVGGAQDRKVEVRILAATHRDLAEEVKTGRFRQDLFYRLNVAAIQIPPLRERREDIPLLADHFLEKFANQNKIPKKRLSAQALTMLMQYDWPGNVRELENLIYNLCVFSSGKQIQIEDLQQKPELEVRMQAPGGKGKGNGKIDALSHSLDSGNINLSEAKRLFEKREIERVLQMHGGRVGEAAQHLGILRPQLSRLLSYHGLKAKN